MLNGGPLQIGQLIAAMRGEIEQLVELSARERCTFRRCLYLNKLAASGHDEIHVNIGGGILGVLKVESWIAINDAHAHGRDDIDHRIRGQSAISNKRRKCEAECDPATADRCTSRAAISVDHVAVDGDHALAQCVEIDDCAQAATDQSLDLHRAAVDFAAAITAFALPR